MSILAARRPVTSSAWWGRMRHVGAGEHRSSIELPDGTKWMRSGGCVVLMKQSVLEQIGLLDED